MTLLKLGSLAGFFLVIGCGDPIRTTTQHVLLKVVDSDSKQIVTDAQVSLRYDYERDIPKAEKRPENERPKYKWFTGGQTNMKGEADIGVQWTMIDRTVGSNPPSSRDAVIGKFYLVRVMKDRTCEELSLLIQRGSSATGKFFDVQVLDYKEPKYIEIDTGGW